MQSRKAAAADPIPVQLRQEAERGETGRSGKPLAVGNRSGHIAQLDVTTAPAPGRARKAAKKPQTLANAHKLMDLAWQGRLWIAENGGHRRATAAEAKERLDTGQPVHILSVVREASQVQSASSSRDYSQSHFWSPGRAASAATCVFDCSKSFEYVTSPITKWSSLPLVEPGEGILGVGQLKGSGLTVTVQVAYENSYRSSWYESWGVFRPGESSGSNEHRVSLQLRTVGAGRG